MKNITIKESLVILIISLIITPLGYLIVTAPPMWWLQ